MIKSSKHQTLIFTNYDGALGIVKQISPSTFSIDKLNFRLIWASKYL